MKGDFRLPGKYDLPALRLYIFDVYQYISSVRLLQSPQGRVVELASVNYYFAGYVHLNINTYNPEEILDISTLMLCKFCSLEL